MLVLLLHLWTPVLSTLALAYGYGRAVSATRFSVAGTVALTAGVLLVYTVDRLVEPGRIEPRLRNMLWAVSLLALGSSLWAAVSELAVLPVQVALGLCSVAYLPLKRVPAAKTAVVAATWWIGCSLLPFHVHDAVKTALSGLFHPAALSIALTVAAGAIMCDYKDVLVDVRDGVRSLPVLVGLRGAIVITSGLSASALFLAAQAGSAALAGAAAFMLVLGLMPGLLRKPLVGPLIVDAALALPGLVVYALSM